MTEASRSIKDLLASSNLTNYESKFVEVGIYEPEDVLELTSNDLDEIGLSAVQHRRLCRHATSQSHTNHKSMGGLLITKGTDLRWRVILLAIAWCGFVLVSRTDSLIGSSWQQGASTSQIGSANSILGGSDKTSIASGGGDRSLSHVQTSHVSENHVQTNPNQHPQDANQIHTLFIPNAAGQSQTGISGPLPQAQQPIFKDHPQPVPRAWQQQQPSNPVDNMPAYFPPGPRQFQLRSDPAIAKARSSAVCVAWRQTGACSASGNREPRNDLSCDECVPFAASGYCECLNGLQAEPQGCGHSSFTCQSACEKLLLGAANSPNNCPSTQPKPPTAILGVGQPFPETAEQPKCKYAASFAEWDPWKGTTPTKCGQDLKDYFKVSATPSEIVISAVDCTTSTATCTIGKHGPTYQLSPSDDLHLNLEPMEGGLLSRGLTDDYALCTCGAQREYVALSTRSRDAVKRITSSFQPPPAHLTQAKAINVVYIMVDAVSRAHFFRALPRTVDAIREIKDQGGVDVFDFEYMNILGAFSPPNRWGAFSGHPPFFADCKYPGNPFESYPDAFHNVESSPQPDSWLWDYFSHRGYVTFSARDMCSKLSKFVYGEYITKPWTDEHFQQMFCDLNFKFLENPQPRCLTNRHAHEIVMDAAKRFREVHSDLEAQFLLLDLIDGHEPSQKLLRTLDIGLPQFIKAMLQDLNTIVFLVSDHGIGDRGKSPSVRLEERFPMSMLFVPSNILTDETRNALAVNQKRIITPLDTFETIARIARLRATGEPLDSRQNIRPWARSLWQEVPNVMCKEAGVPIKACGCAQYGVEDASRPPVRW